MRHILTQMIASILDSLAAILLRISLIYKCTANNILIYEMIETFSTGNQKIFNCLKKRITLKKI